MRRFIQFRVGVVLIAVLALGAILVGVSIGPMMYSARVISSGLVKSIGVGVYNDNNCSEVMSSIEWGIVEPGSQYNVSVYVRNEGNIGVTLFLNATDWDPPEAETYLALSWNYTGQPVLPNHVIPVILTLSVGTDAPGGTSFAFNIVITAIG